MRLAALLLPFLAACATPVRDFPRGNPLPSDQALLAGSMHFEGSVVQQRLLLRAPGVGEISLRPGLDPFLVAVPPGVYEVVSIGGYYPTVDRPRIEAVAGEARYMGAFHVARDRDGELKIVVRNGQVADGPWLREMYPSLPAPLPTHLVQSSLEPIPGTTELVIAVERPVAPAPHYHYRVGFGFHDRGRGHRR